MKKNLGVYFAALLFMSATIISCAHQEQDAEDRLLAEAEANLAASEVPADEKEKTAVTGEEERAAKTEEKMEGLTQAEEAISPADQVEIAQAEADAEAATPAVAVAQPAPGTAPTTVVAAAPAVYPESKPSPEIVSPEKVAPPATVAATTHPKRSLASQTRKVASAAAPKNVFNRFYYMRAGDTAESLSKLFYGTEGRASELTAWNGPATAWEPGKIIYYHSSVNPHDAHLLSVYDEKQMTPDLYVVKMGDSLKSLGREKLGNEGSGQEIAAVNHMPAGQALVPGHAIKIYPSWHSEKPAVDLAAAETPKLQATADAIAAAEVAAKKAERPKAEPPKPELASLQIASFVQHNTLVIACSAVVAFLTLAFVFNRRRGRERIDF